MIKIDTLQSVKNDQDDEDSADDAVNDLRHAAAVKKPKLGAASTSKHSLFGMLPAPKRKDDEVLAERRETKLRRERRISKRRKRKCQ